MLHFPDGRSETGRFKVKMKRNAENISVQCDSADEVEIWKNEEIPEVNDAKEKNVLPRFSLLQITACFRADCLSQTH